MKCILEQFPQWQAEIEQLMLESADFQELCQDYEDMRALVATWADTDNSVDQATIAEYQTLLSDLETEIMEDLHARFGAAALSDENSAAHPTGFGDEAA